MMIAHISPASSAFEESRNTLTYAGRAKNIKTRVRVPSLSPLPGQDGSPTPIPLLPAISGTKPPLHWPHPPTPPPSHVTPMPSPAPPTPACLPGSPELLRVPSFLSKACAPGPGPLRLPLSILRSSFRCHISKHLVIFITHTGPFNIVSRLLLKGRRSNHCHTVRHRKMRL